MENNNQNLNEQVNQKNNDNQQIKTSNNKNVLIALMALIIVGLAGYIVYVKFIQKPDTSTPKDDNIQSQENNNQNEQQHNNIESKDIVVLDSEEYDVTKRETYKSKDGKNELIIVPKNDSKAVQEAKKIDSAYPVYDGFVYYNGKLFVAYFDKIGKYIDVSADIIGEYGQCSNYGFVVDAENSILLDMDYKYSHSVYKINDNYYFSDSVCIEGNKAIYNEDLVKIGTEIFGYDKKNFYILDGNIIKYNSSGEVVSRSVERYNIDDYDSIEHNGIMYIVINNKKDIYFVDTSDFKATKLGTSDELNYGFFDFNCLKKENGKIIAYFYDTRNTDEKSYDDIIFEYDPVTKELKKK